MPLVPSSVTCVLARTADAHGLPASLPMTLAVSPFADHTPLRPMRPVAARFGALLTSLRPSPGAAARARVLPMPLPFPGAVSRVASSAARALPPSAAAGLGALPMPLPSLLAACALARPLRSSSGAPPVASRPSLRAPAAGTLPRLRALPPLPDHASGVLLPPQLRQRDARRRTLGHRGAERPRPPLREVGLGGVRLGRAVWVWLGFEWARYLAPSLPPAAAAAAPGEALGARAGPAPRAGGMPGAVA